MRRTQSNGSAGEMAAGFLFAKLGWYMTRLQQPFRVVGVEKSALKVVPLASGQPDFVGYRMDDPTCVGVPVFVAAEAKESSHPDRLPASALRPDQRMWMRAVPPGSRFVVVFWPCGTVELFQFEDKGSYKRGEGRAR